MAFNAASFLFYCFFILPLKHILYLVLIMHKTEVFPDNFLIPKFAFEMTFGFICNPYIKPIYLK